VHNWLAGYLTSLLTKQADKTWRKKKRRREDLENVQVELNFVVTNVCLRKIGILANVCTGKIIILFTTIKQKTKKNNVCLFICFVLFSCCSFSHK
jgi:hypothetical protein